MHLLSWRWYEHGIGRCAAHRTDPILAAPKLTRGQRSTTHIFGQYGMQFPDQSQADRQSLNRSSPYSNART